MTDSRIEQADLMAADWDNRSPIQVADWVEIARARHVPTPYGMPAGLHLNLGAGRRQIGDAMPFDLERGWDADMTGLPYPDGAVAGIWAHAFFGYVAHPVAVLGECARVLQSGGVLNIVEPHGLSDLWAEDVQRRNRFTEETWKNLLDNKYWDPLAGRSVDLPFTVRTCFIMGVVWRNLSLFTQLVRS